jgi:low temperature requirement protein LtrA
MSDANLPHRLRLALARHGIWRSPDLQTDSDRTASRLELFFDLAFVLVITQLAGGLRADVTVHGALVFAGLFTVVWWSWVSSTLYANRFDHDDVVYRLFKLGGMASVIGMAAAAMDATGSRLAVFAGCAAALRGLLLLQYLRAFRHVPRARPVVRVYAGTIGVGMLLFAVSPAVGRPGCFAVWAVALAVEVYAPLRATGRAADVPLHMEHLPERFALLVILVLGESVAAVANGLVAAQWSGRAVAVAAACFVLAAALWWSYFDLAGAGAKRLLSRAGSARSEWAHDVFVFGHLPQCLALSAVGAGIQLAVLESGRGEVPTGVRSLVAGGVALYLGAVAVTNTGMAGTFSRTWRSGWWWPLAAAGVAGLDALVALPSLVVVGSLAVLVAAVVAVGTTRRTSGRLEVEAL